MNPNPALRRFLVRFILLAVGLPPALATAAEPGADLRTLRHGGLDRHYLVRVPEHAPGARLPVVLVLHGGGGHAENIEATTGFTALAKREGFIAVYPEGTGRFAHRMLAWNAVHCCGPAMTQQVDDAGFIRALLDRLAADLPVDPRRVYATGLSNGGMMTHRLGIALSDRLAAIAPVAATVFGDEPAPASPVAALMVNGALDVSVPPAGGPPGGRFREAWDGAPTQPALAQGAFWAKANGCDATPERAVTGTLTRWRYRCAAGRDVELLLVADQGHAWPGGERGSRLGDAPSRTVQATELIWQFFKQQSK